jgi:hypothetical protein
MLPENHETRGAIDSRKAPKTGKPISQGSSQMLAEKFLLLLETLRSQTRPDGSPNVVSSSPHVPIKLPRGNAK